MDIKGFLNTVCQEIKYEPARKGIAEELELHMQEVKEDYINSGLEEIEAEEKTVSQMGIAEEIGKKLNKIHKPKLDWKLLILIVILMGFGLTISILKQSTVNNNHLIENTIIYMLVGVGLGVVVYFFDYKKMKRYSDLIYLIASVIMILPIVGLGSSINGSDYVKIWSITFTPCTVTIPLYLIAFIGYVANYNKNNVIKIPIRKKEWIIPKDLIKTLIFCIFSLILTMYVSSITNVIILSFVYLVITTVKIVQDQKKGRLKKLAIIYGVISIFVIPFIISIIASPFRLSRIIASFQPEMDPNGSGYVGMLQKEVLENAKFLGEAETKVISNDKSIINLESNYTFIYLLGKVGVLISGILVLIILLTSLKLILNAKNIKEQYGKLLIIGLSTLYILQSVANVLMNVNMGIATNINLPFVTYGGIYFIVNIVSIAIIFSVYRRKDINLYEERSEKVYKKNGK